MKRRVRLEMVEMAMDRTVVVVREWVDKSNWECGSSTVRVVVVGSGFAIGSDD